MRSPPDGRRAPPGGNGAPPKIIAVNSNNLKHSPQALEKQAALRRRCNYARDAVFAEFPYRHARAIDYDGFIDR